MRAELRGVIFDYGNVISFPQDQREVYRMAGRLKMDDVSEFLKVYGKWRNEYDAGCSGLTYWTRVMEDFGKTVDPETVRQLIEMDALSWTHVNPGTLRLIERLRSDGMRLALLSNMPVEILAYMKKECLWLNLFETLVFSCDLGITKPNPEIYLRCVARMGLQPEQCLFIDDLQANVNGAKSCGLGAIRFESPSQVQEAIQAYRM